MKLNSKGSAIQRIKKQFFHKGDQPMKKTKFTGISDYLHGDGLAISGI
jgi:hypothetical protein